MKEKVYSVYLFTFPNGKKYCGQTSKKPERRWGGSGQGYEKCPLVYKAILKYGWNNVKKEVLFQFNSQQQAYDKEKEIIAALNLANPEYGYNLHSGGCPTGAGDFLTEEGRKKISEHSKAMWQDPEMRAKMLNRNQHYLTEEDWKKGQIAAAAAKKGKPASNGKPVLQIDIKTDEIIKEYPSGGFAARGIGKDISAASNILAVCRGSRNTAYGYKWRFKETQ